MRCYLTLQSHLKTRGAPGTNALQQSLELWFGATERHAEQLHEMERTHWRDEAQGSEAPGSDGATWLNPRASALAKGAGHRYRSKSIHTFDGHARPAVLQTSDNDGGGLVEQINKDDGWSTSRPPQVQGRDSDFADLLVDSIPGPLRARPEGA